MSRFDLDSDVEVDAEASDPLCAAEKRALRFRGGSREPSAMRLAAIREKAHAQWRAGHEERARERRRRGTAGGALAATVAIAAALLLTVAPQQSHESSQPEPGMFLADAWSCGPSFPVGAYCPPGTAASFASFDALASLGEESRDDRLACRLFSPNAVSCF